MITAVLDTNIIVSANLVELGISNKLLQAARFKRFQLVTSFVIITEVMHTLSKKRIKRKYNLTTAHINRIRDLLEKQSVNTQITIEVHGVATHPEDDLILATAVSAKADYLVTGDAQLQRLEKYEGVIILSPRAFLTILSEKN